METSPHLDPAVSGKRSPEEQSRRVADEVATPCSAGAALLAEFTGHHAVMADPEGKEFCAA